MMNIALKYKNLPFRDKVYQTGLVLILIISSGFPMFVNDKLVYITTFLYSLAGVIMYKPDLRWVFKYSSFFILLMLFQTAFWGAFYITTAINQILLFTTACFSIAILGTNFIYLYKKTLVIIAAIASLLFIPMLIIPGFSDTLISASPIHISKTAEAYGWESTSHNIFIMNFPPDFFEGLVRNSGPFWEPGAFGGYLLIALIFDMLTTKTWLKKDNIILVVAIITTFSTTTYLAFAVFLCGYAFFKIKSPGVKWGLMIILLAVSAISFFKIEFLGKKIQEEIDDAEYYAFTKGGDGRVASALLDLAEIRENAFFIFFGRGSHQDTRVAGDDKEVLRNNGITDLLTRYGLFFFIFSIISIALSFKQLTKIGNIPSSLAYLSLFVVLILSFSEVYFIFLVFKCLTLLYMAPLPNRKRVRIIIDKTIDSPNRITPSHLHTGLKIANNNL
ncbi:hypothetical protein [Pararcticibacter amylolyticus]|uniref:O-antigen ligase domain-containing protein n=1 Tax=Pararcticibacter amylolyticus TaxID=2173175 RepID=A0A2U2PBM9_9SPHI|nr:hypothetical protein [Pararcticibacter amylolyticus]PWG78808.1 hypothetical protein DDR33_20500 [Pararcticibacter amylolyticus]